MMWLAVFLFGVATGWLPGFMVGRFLQRRARGDRTAALEAHNAFLRTMRTEDVPYDEPPQGRRKVTVTRHAATRIKAP